MNKNKMIELFNMINLLQATVFMSWRPVITLLDYYRFQEYFRLLFFDLLHQHPKAFRDIQSSLLKKVIGVHMHDKFIQKIIIREMSR